MSLVAILGILSISVARASAAGWLPRVNASPSGEYGAIVDIGVDGQGEATAVWLRYTDSPPNELFTRNVMVATRPLGGSWSAAVPISPADEEAWVPAVAVDAAGDAVAAWGRWNFSEPGLPVDVATRPAGGAWSAPVLLSTGMSNGWQVAIDEDGDATAIWTEAHEGSEVVRSATKPAGGAWSSAISLSDENANASEHPLLAVDPAGNATAVWSLREAGAEEGELVLQAKSRPAGGAWDAVPIDLSSEEGNATPGDLALGPGGEVTAVWTHYDGEEHTVQASRKEPGGGWSAAEDLSDDEAAEPQIAVDPEGRATAIWGAFGPGGYEIRASGSEAGGGWSAPVTLSAADGTKLKFETPGPELVVDPDGNATATWRVFAGYDIHGLEYFRVRAAHRPLGDNWSAAVDLSPVGKFLGSAPLTVDPQGYVTAIRQEGSIRTRVFDPVAPELHNLTVPSTGMAGQPLAMSVDPFDIWPPVATSWDFGDGGSDSGAAVSHCYSTPGERTVAVTGTDGAANETSESRTISIEPDPSLDPGSDPCAPEEPDPEEEPTPPKEPVTPNQPGSPGQTDPSGSGAGSAPAPPVLSGLRQSHLRWRARGSRRRSRLPVGTTFRFRLDRRARVLFAFSRIMPGRRSGARCVRVTRVNRKRHRCPRYRFRGALRTTGRTGLNAYRFRGKFHGSTLAPGRYRLLVTALAGGENSGPASIRFTIAR